MPSCRFGFIFHDPGRGAMFMGNQIGRICAVCDLSCVIHFGLLPARWTGPVASARGACTLSDVCTPRKEDRWALIAALAPPWPRPTAEREAEP